MKENKPSSFWFWNVLVCLGLAALNIGLKEPGMAIVFSVFGFLMWLAIPVYKPESKTEEPKP